MNQQNAARPTPAAVTATKTSLTVDTVLSSRLSAAEKIVSRGFCELPSPEPPDIVVMTL